MNILKVIAKYVALLAGVLFAYFWTAKHPMDNATISFYICVLFFYVSWVFVQTRND